MYSLERYMQSAETWQEAWWAYGKMLASANADLGERAMSVAVDAMTAEGAVRAVLEKPATFARAFDLAKQIAAERRSKNTALT